MPREFTANEEFCSRCLTHESFWKGGGSWTPDWCPCWTSFENLGDAILWKNMNESQRREAAEKFEDMWNQKFRLGKYSLDHLYNVIGREPMKAAEKPYTHYTVSDCSNQVPSPSGGHWRSVAGVYDLIQEDSPRISIGENSWKCTGKAVATFKDRALAQKVADLLNKDKH